MSGQHPLERFKALIDTFDQRISSAALILESANKVLLVKSTNKSYWTFPGGMVDQGESPKDAAVRELKEEMNLSVDPDSLKFAWVVSRSSRVAMSYQFIFKASLESLDLNDIEPQASEVEDWQIISREDILSGDRHYSKAAEAWARGFDAGYMEQVFGKS